MKEPLMLIVAVVAVIVAMMAGVGSGLPARPFTINVSRASTPSTGVVKSQAINFFELNENSGEFMISALLVDAITVPMTITGNFTIDDTAAGGPARLLSNPTPFTLGARPSSTPQGEWLGHNRLLYVCMADANPIRLLSSGNYKLTTASSAWSLLYCTPEDTQLPDHVYMLFQSTATGGLIRVCRYNTAYFESLSPSSAGPEFPTTDATLMAASGQLCSADIQMKTVYTSARLSVTNAVPYVSVNYVWSVTDGTSTTFYSTLIVVDFSDCPSAGCNHYTIPITSPATSLLSSVNTNGDVTAAFTLGGDQTLLMFFTRPTDGTRLMTALDPLFLTGLPLNLLIEQVSDHITVTYAVTSTSSQLLLWSVVLEDDVPMTKSYAQLNMLSSGELMPMMRRTHYGTIAMTGVATGAIAFDMVTISDCSSPTDAYTCLVQPHCIWHLTTMTCMYRMRANEHGLVYPDVIDFVPAIADTDISKVAGSTAGGTTVIISNIIINGVTATNLLCRFGTTPSAASYDRSAGTVTCKSPAVTETGYLSFNLLYLNKLYAPKTYPKYYYYPCSNLNTCVTCTHPITLTGGVVVTSECGWCTIDHTCLSQVAESCPTALETPSALEINCPALQAITPERGYISTTMPVDLTVSNLSPRGSYTCHFNGMVADSAATVVKSGQVGRLSCTAEALSVTSETEIYTNVTVLVTKTNGNVVNYVDSDVTIGFNALRYTWFSCPFYTSCSACKAAGCNWCANSSGVNMFCSMSTTECGEVLGSSSTTCPALTTMAPASYDLESPPTVHSSSAGTFDLSITVSSVPDILQYSIKMGTAILTSYAYNAATKTFTIPITVSTKEAMIPLSILAGNAQQTFLSLPSFYFYNCTAHSTTCSACIAVGGGKCGWCIGNPVASCKSQPKCGTIGWASTTCPDKLTALTPSVYNAEGTTIKVSGGPFPSSVRSFRCVLTKVGTSTPINYTAAWVDSNTMKCSLPPLTDLYNSSAFYTLGLREISPQDTTYSAMISSAMSLVAVNCVPQVYRSCLSCSTVAASRCVWSLSDLTCTTTDRLVKSSWGVTHLSGSCPTVTAISPSSGFDDGSAFISIVGNNFINNSLLLSFSSASLGTTTVPTAWVNASLLHAQSPAGIAPGSYQVSIVTSTGETYGAASWMYFDFTAAPKSSSSNTGAIIGGAVGGGIGIALILAAAAVLIVLLARRRSAAKPFIFNIKDEPDFMRFAFSLETVPLGVGVRASDRNWATFAALLREKPIAGALSEITQVTESDKVANSLIYISASTGNVLTLINNFISEEVTNVRDENQLFRANSMASKMFRAFSKIVGLKYLWMTFARFVNELEHLADLANAQEAAKKGKKSGDNNEAEMDTHLPAPPPTSSILTTDIEIDPTKIGSGADEESQAYLLAQRARSLMLAILHSTPNMPLTLRWVVKQIRDQVRTRFPGSEHIAIGGTIFLRFICPALTIPHTYGLIKKPPSERLQRQLILIGKVFQGLANQVLFGKKEGYMSHMNDFIAKNLEPLQKWMETICLIGSDTPREDSSNVPPEVLAGSLGFLRNHVNTNMPKIRNHLQAHGGEQYIPQLEAALASVQQQ